ncbi:MAG: hypothetical protein M1839_001656 [Geoglossum umbratile]|nr:MAG: hypothetical protein M1839_001656 [Geoglossum umbratile]
MGLMCRSDVGPGQKFKTLLEGLLREHQTLQRAGSDEVAPDWNFSFQDRHITLVFGDKRLAFTPLIVVSRPGDKTPVFAFHHERWKHSQRTDAANAKIAPRRNPYRGSESYYEWSQLQKSGIESEKLEPHDAATLIALAQRKLRENPAENLVESYLFTPSMDRQAFLLYVGIFTAEYLRGFLDPYIRLKPDGVTVKRYRLEETGHPGVTHAILALLNWRSLVNHPIEVPGSSTYGSGSGGASIHGGWTLTGDNEPVAGNSGAGSEGGPPGPLLQLPPPLFAPQPPPGFALQPPPGLALQQFPPQFFLPALVEPPPGRLHPPEVLPLQPPYAFNTPIARQHVTTAPSPANRNADPAARGLLPVPDTIWALHSRTTYESRSQSTTLSAPVYRKAATSTEQGPTQAPQGEPSSTGSSQKRFASFRKLRPKIPLDEVRIACFRKLRPKNDHLKPKVRFSRRLADREQICLSLGEPAVPERDLPKENFFRRPMRREFPRDDEGWEDVKREDGSVMRWRRGPSPDVVVLKRDQGKGKAI